MINNRAVDMYEKYMQLDLDEPTPKGRGLLTPMKAMSIETKVSDFNFSPKTK